MYMYMYMYMHTDVYAHLLQTHWFSVFAHRIFFNNVQEVYKCCTHANIIMSLCSLCSESDPHLQHLFTCSIPRSCLIPCVKRKKIHILQHARQGRHQTIAQLSGPKPTMLASSVQSVVACNVTAPRVCTLVLFINNISHAIGRSLAFCFCGKHCILIEFFVPYYTAQRLR